MHGFNFEHLMKAERNLASRLFLSEILVLDFHLLYLDGGSMEHQNELIFFQDLENALGNIFCAYIFFANILKVPLLKHTLTHLYWQLM